MAHTVSSSSSSSDGSGSESESRLGEPDASSPSSSSLDFLLFFSFFSFFSFLGFPSFFSFFSAFLRRRSSSACLSSSAPSSSRSFSARLSCLSFLEAALSFSGGFLRMKVVSLCLMSTSETKPQALHLSWMVSFLVMLMTVSGLPQLWHCTKRLIKPSRCCARTCAECAPLTMYVPLFSSHLVSAPSS